jgi:hypothetical protein
MPTFIRILHPGDLGLRHNDYIFGAAIGTGSTFYALLKVDLYRHGMSSEQAAEKRPSAAFPSSFVIAAYHQVRLTPQDFGSSRKRDFAKLNLHLDIFDQPGRNDFFSRLLYHAERSFGKDDLSVLQPLRKGTLPVLVVLVGVIEPGMDVHALDLPALFSLQIPP